MTHRLRITAAVVACGLAALAIGAAKGDSHLRFGRDLSTGTAVAGAIAGSAASRPTYWAVVAPSGHLLYRSPGVTGASRTPRSPRGDYLVSFSTAVRHCAWIATPRRIGTAEASAADATTDEPAQANKVRVHTFNEGHGGQDSGFSLAVVC